MTSRITTILIIGGTSGIGEAFARRFHSLGKKVIITGRREDRLADLANELPGLETRKWDILDLTSLSKTVSEILTAHPTIDAVFINAGIQRAFSLLEPPSTSSHSDTDIISEINTNLTSPMLLTRLFVPHLISLAKAGKPATILITSSTLAYFPFPFFPAYCATKGGIHSLCVVLRQQINTTLAADENVMKNMKVVEVVPPYTDTGIDTTHREEVIQMQGGPEKAVLPVPLAGVIDGIFEKLDEQDGEVPREVGVGHGEYGAQTWRDSFGKALQGFGLDC